MKYTTLAEATAAYPFEHLASDGVTTNLWHRQHEHYIEHVVPLLPTCEICGGKLDPLATRPRHELCRLRLQRYNTDVPRIDDVRECGCAFCHAKGGAL